MLKSLLVRNTVWSKYCDEWQLAMSALHHNIPTKCNKAVFDWCVLVADRWHGRTTGCTCWHCVVRWDEHGTLQFLLSCYMLLTDYYYYCCCCCLIPRNLCPLIYYVTNSTLAWKKVVNPFTGLRENCKKLFLHLCPKLMRKNYMPKDCWKI